MSFIFQEEQSSKQREENRRLKRILYKILGFKFPEGCVVHHFDDTIDPQTGLKDSSYSNVVFIPIRKDLEHNQNTIHNYISAKNRDSQIDRKELHRLEGYQIDEDGKGYHKLTIKEIIQRTKNSNLKALTIDQALQLLKNQED